MMMNNLLLQTLASLLVDWLVRLHWQRISHTRCTNPVRSATTVVPYVHKTRNLRLII